MDGWMEIIAKMIWGWIIGSPPGGDRLKKYKSIVFNRLSIIQCALNPNNQNMSCDTLTYCISHFFHPSIFLLKYYASDLHQAKSKLRVT